MGISLQKAYRFGRPQLETVLVGGPGVLHLLHYMQMLLYLCLWKKKILILVALTMVVEVFGSRAAVVLCC